MPTVSLESNVATSSTSLPPGTYHSTDIALTDGARDPNYAIQVGIGKVEVLKQSDARSTIWTDSLQSCFPVIFKFRNGDIGLYHGNDASLDNVMPLLQRGDLEEIQLFTKGTQINSRKVGGFSENLMKHLAKQDNPPVVNMQTNQQDYGVALCYKTDKGPVMLVGKSGGTNGMVKESTQDDVITQYQFQSLAPQPSSQIDNRELQQEFKEVMQDHRKKGNDNPQKQGCCVIL